MGESYDSVDVSVGVDAGRVEHHAATRSADPTRASALPHPLAPACLRPHAVEMPISVSNFKLCNRKWHLGEGRWGNGGADADARGSTHGGRGECGNGVAHAGTRAGRDRDSTTTLAHGIEIIVSADRAFDGIPGLTRVAPPPGTPDAPLSPDSSHGQSSTVSPARSVQQGQSSRDVPYAATPSIATRSWLTAWE